MRLAVNLQEIQQNPKYAHKRCSRVWHLNRKREFLMSYSNLLVAFYVFFICRLQYEYIPRESFHFCSENILIFSLNYYIVIMTKCLFSEKINSFKRTWQTNKHLKNIINAINKKKWKWLDDCEFRLKVRCEIIYLLRKMIESCEDITDSKNLRHRYDISQ